MLCSPNTSYIDLLRLASDKKEKEKFTASYHWKKNQGFKKLTNQLNMRPPKRIRQGTFLCNNMHIFCCFSSTCVNFLELQQLTKKKLKLPKETFSTFDDEAGY